MIFNILSIYKDIINSFADCGVIGKGVQSGAIAINSIDIRDYTIDKHRRVDDYPYGGGAGMVMCAQPVCDSVEAIKNGRDIPVVFFTPRGRVFSSSVAKEYSKADELILLCGHFEGIDERAISLLGCDEISIGDYILTGGHLAAMVFVDAVSRYVDGVLGNEKSAGEETFENSLVEYEQYTRPYDFRGLTVPDVLLSGNHKLIEEYKRERSELATIKYRPDLVGRTSVDD
ncbi:MAG: tRNA (guanosine(37)-N1)-methyltransferase TrmD [Eubacteriaceae bacterium]|nr:tRNA (guanosine(37)-N1)-methyltransferase TrmD [Eubacteriaceae bacterium]